MSGISITPFLVILIAKAWASPQLSIPIPLILPAPQAGGLQLHSEISDQCELHLRSPQLNLEPCVGEFERIGNNCYLLSWKNKDTLIKQHWHKAREICKKKGSSLGVSADLAGLPLSKDSAYADCLIMRDIGALGKGNGVWLGATDLSVEGHWRWVHSNMRLSLTNPFWGPGEPNGNLDENCLCGWHYGDNHRAFFNDAACQGHTFDFICQIYP